MTRRVIPLRPRRPRFDFDWLAVVLLGLAIGLFVPWVLE